MRMTPSVALCLLALSSAFAGCLEDPPEPASPPVAVAEPEPVLPEGFTESGAIVPSVYGSTGYCQGAHVCVSYPFTIDEGWSETEGRLVAMDARLSWDLPANELDLVLYRGETEVDADYQVGTTGASLTTLLDSGDYVLLVDSYATVGADAFELAVAFTDESA